MIKNKMLIKKRLRSTNLYVINPIFMINDIKRDVSNRNINVSNRKVLIEPSNIPTNYPSNITNNSLSNKIEGIVNNKSLDKQNKIIKIAQCMGLPELKECITNNIHPYYARVALELKEQELRDQKAVPKNILDQRLSSALKTNSKNRSAAYKAKVEYNKRNNLDWQGKPKK